MKVLITGAAGFIGSTLADHSLARGDEVVGVDCFTDYYDVAQKHDNVAAARANDRFRLVETDLAGAEVSVADVAALLDGVDVVYHQAGQPGVRSSWGLGFEEYTRLNVLATQRLLEAAKGSGLQRFVYASSSSVYGNAPSYPTTEDDLPRPQSPYGVTKLAAEHLCGLYARNFGVPTTSLRYFTVYGPRQRPDMATHRLCEAAIDGTSFPLFGDGSKVRDFTFVDDVVAANLAAGATACEPGTVVNVAGGSNATMAYLIDLVGAAVGRPVQLDRQPDAAGDVERTGGSIERTTALLGWTPRVTLEDGVERQAAWHLARRG